MKKLKNIFIFLLIIIASTGGVGCMSQNVININKDELNKEGGELVLSYLNEKYSGEEFTIDDLFREIDGDSGNYYRAVCESLTYPSEKFTTYVYLNGSDMTLNEVDEVKEIETDNQIEYMDDYANIVVAHKYQNILQGIVNDDVIVKCNVQFVNSKYIYTIDEMNGDFESAIAISDKDVFVKIFVIGNVEKSSFNNSLDLIIDETKKHNAYGQYVYVCDCEKDNNSIENDYFENYDDFDTYARYYADYIDSVECIIVKNKKIAERKFIKE